MSKSELQAMRRDCDVELSFYCLKKAPKDEAGITTKLKACGSCGLSAEHLLFESVPKGRLAEAQRGLRRGKRGKGRPPHDEDNRTVSSDPTVSVNTEPCDVRETARLLAMGDAWNHAGDLEIPDSATEKWEDVLQHLDDIGCVSIPLAIVMLLHPLQSELLVFPIDPAALQAAGAREDFASQIHPRRTLMNRDIANRLKYGVVSFFVALIYHLHWQPSKRRDTSTFSFGFKAQ
ncbi:hypothetical protein D9619_008746 [Psilocybe cf. subviscida]|uniref:Uncharacterized protein n=1 Tax=Psilocybe cf. subviscida TaxID=2480587 RepID=A0A8H5F167_9AGAR|nr:hypothetical protein D9619_008746 [Psilocybe cf. subviscida]